MPAERGGMVAGWSSSLWENKPTAAAGAARQRLCSRFLVVALPFPSARAPLPLFDEAVSTFRAHQPLYTIPIIGVVIKLRLVCG